MLQKGQLDGVTRGMWNFILYGPLEITGGGSTRREAQICRKCAVFKEDHINAVEAEWLATKIINAELNCFLLFDETCCTRGIYKYSYSYLWLTKTSCLFVGQDVPFIVIPWPSNSMVNIQFEKRIACGFQKKRKCKQNFVAQLCVVDLGCV